MRTGFRGRRWLKPLVEVSLPGGHFSPTVQHWRCGGILCSVCLVLLLIKDAKAHY